MEDALATLNLFCVNKGLVHIQDKSIYFFFRRRREEWWLWLGCQLMDRIGQDTIQ